MNIFTACISGPSKSNCCRLNPFPAYVNLVQSEHSTFTMTGNNLDALKESSSNCYVQVEAD